MHHCYIDKFAYQSSVIHGLDSRVKFLAVAVFTAVVISLPATSVSVLACYAVGPFAILVLAQIPLKFAIKQTLLVSPFILILAFSFVLYSKEPRIVAFGPLEWRMRAGWVQCFSMLGKFLVTMPALIGLVSTTKFNDLLAGLRKLGLPAILVLQLSFLYRYIFLLIDRAGHMLRARAGRKLRNLGFSVELKTAGAMIGALFITSLETAERVNISMQARGFDGQIRTGREMKIGIADYVFCVLFLCFLLVLQFLIRPILP